MATQNITLDINQQKSSVSANVQQNDVDTRTLVINLTEDGIPYTPGSGTTALLEYEKPDNTKLLEKYSISGSTITINMTDQMMCVPGICYGRIELIKNGTSLHTVVFKVRVYEGLIQGSEITSSTEYNALVDVITEAKQVIKRCEELIQQMSGK